jgi:hypothetical protein
LNNEASTLVSDRVVPDNTQEAVLQTKALLMSSAKSQGAKIAVREQVVAGPAWVNLSFMRCQMGESQFAFWDRFGVTQSAGSRYEADARRMPTALTMLIIAFATQELSEKTMKKLLESAERLAARNDPKQDLQ